MSESNLFGREMRRLRRSTSQPTSLADVADSLDCSITYVSALERGERNPPSDEMIINWLECLGCSDEFDAVKELAQKSRKAIEIPVVSASEGWKEFVLALARLSEEGKLSDDDNISIEIRKLIDPGE